jgi:hypothetical protein
MCVPTNCIRLSEADSIILQMPLYNNDVMTNRTQSMMPWSRHTQSIRTVCNIHGNLPTSFKPINISVLGYKVEDWIHLAQDRLQWRALVKMLVCVPKSTPCNRALFQELTVILHSGGWNQDPLDTAAT